MWPGRNSSSAECEGVFGSTPRCGTRSGCRMSTRCILQPEVINDAQRSIKDIEEAITQACCGKCSSHMNDSAVRVAGGRLPNAVGPHALCEASAAEIEVQSRSVDHATERFRVGDLFPAPCFAGRFADLKVCEKRLQLRERRPLTPQSLQDFAFDGSLSSPLSSPAKAP